MKKIISVILLAAMLVSSLIFAGTSSAYTTWDDDPIPENIGSVREYSGVKVSYTRTFIDANGQIPVGAGVGAHGAYETRIVRTANGTYAAFITDATGEATPEHPGWNCGVATFSIVKITATGFERIFTAEYPQALGSCTPNLVQSENGIVYCVIIADDKDRRQSEYCNGVWLEVYKLDTATDTVTKPGGTQKYRHTTSPTDDHGYGYTQPVFDFEHGKMYALTCGGEAPGFLAWWIYDLNTDRWNSTCHTVQLFTRRCYINGYADGNGGFTIVIERCAPIKALKQALGVQFSLGDNSYVWDGLYLMHVANPNVNAFTDTEIAVAHYTAEGRKNSGKNDPDTVSHYGNGGCTYLDDQDRVHVIYSHKIGNTRKTTVYHAVYDLSGNELFKETLSTTLVPSNGGSPTPKSYAMTQDTDGTYYVFCEMSSSGKAALQLWKSNADDGLHFTKLSTQTVFEKPNGGNVSPGKFIIGNSRCYSEKDGYVPLMFEGSESGECFFYTCIALPNAVRGEEPEPEPEPLLGDVDGDGVVVAKDARLLKQYMVGLVSDDAIVFANADINGDGDITAKDSRGIKALLVG
ncbi:MAG: dockerin type I repeat-containing protein [Clostridia bacterium]|nr:dockerin type I repeat-containing protein [Clostridia bacterium]